MMCNKNKYFFGIAFLFLLILSGCGMFHEDLKNKDCDLENTTAILVLRINKISHSSRSEDLPGVSEEINSLRIIITNPYTNLIEVNEFIQKADFNGISDENIHVFSKKLLPGQKNFFLIANEEVVTGIINSNNNTSQNLHDILNSYEASYSNGQELASLLNSISFNPNYTIDNNSISLPYTSFYTMLLEAGKKYDPPMYLVPVATKYNVSITNFRNDDVIIKELYINSIASQNYLMPHVGMDNYLINGIYWIDWLANVATLSQEYPEFDSNESFNNEWGWLTDYQLPDGTIHSPVNIISGRQITVDAQSNPESGSEPEPGTLSIPTFYLPESNNVISTSSKQNVQSYSIKLIVQDKNSEEEVTLTRTLSNVKALFRNTHLNLNIQFSAGYMHVYGEIIGWKDIPVVNGFLIEEIEE